MQRAKQWQGLVMPVGLLAAVLAIFMQVPPAMLDLLLAANLALAVIVLLTTLYVRTPLEFSVFPTVLLAATLGRLSLNIASTRLILLNGETLGADAAGGVIRSFGQFVAGDQLAVGMLIFLILVAVQFLVITSGASRISEVAARFALDGMPGRQLSVDGDLNAGLIDPSQARQRREDITSQADFYGAMDGASKFVRGDAVAGLLIVAVNLCGGLLVGVSSGLSVGEAGQLYAKLTIGDGLVTQVPALLISIASGILVSRSARSTQLPNEFVRQLFSRPEALAVAGVFLIALTTAKLPAAPLLTLGAACGGLALLLARRGSEEPESDETSQSASGSPQRAKGPESSRPAELLQVDPLTLELGVNLIKLADPKSDGGLLAHVSYLREQLAAELGFLLPRVRIRDNQRLGRNQYRITMSSAPVAEGQLRAAMKLAVPRGAARDTVIGEPTEDPVTGQPAWWIPPSTEHELRGAGCQVRSAVEVLMDHFYAVARGHAAELLTRDATRQLLDELARTAPAAVEELTAGPLRLGEVQQALQGLLAEGVTIRPLARILEALSDAASQQLGPAASHEFVRRRLGRLLVAPLCDADGTLHAIVCDELERQASNAKAGPGAGGDVEPVWASELADAIRRTGCRVLITRGEVRAEVQRWIVRRAPDAVVLSFDEIPPETPLVAVAADETHVLQGAA